MSTAATAAYTGGLCFAFIMIWVAVRDFSTMRIRNEISIFLLAAYAALAPLTGSSLEYIGLSAAVAVGTFCVTFIFFARGWIGGGDAKILPIAVLWIGPNYAVDFLTYTVLFGGVLSLIILSLRSLAVSVAWIDKLWIVQGREPWSSVPYGFAIAVGALTILPNTIWYAPHL